MSPRKNPVLPVSLPVPPTKINLKEVRKAAACCKACDLWKLGTQTVFGDGNPHAKIMFVGEQPGDREDLQGQPFVGPAGQLLDRALQEVGLDRKSVYLTNAVKHFKWVPDSRGKRRIHKKPRYSEIQACRPWLDAEVALIRPQVLVCLGATAAQALLGKTFSVTRQRAQWITSQLAPNVMATVHPSSILRAKDSESRRAQFEMFVRDLRRVVMVLDSSKKAA
ncbi:MAG TPA: UdgX family uracil-DNA binding protein [Terriglobales bacterium]|nr:UdgX family uracil-DNA binding protein [Terriglobales bacterium]